jgi:hypothetical protein
MFGPIAILAKRFFFIKSYDLGSGGRGKERRAMSVAKFASRTLDFCASRAFFHCKFWPMRYAHCQQKDS